MAIDNTDLLATRIADAVAAATAKATLEVQSKIRPVEKNAPSLVSAYNPSGKTKRPTLRRKTYFCNAEQVEKFLTDAEIDLFNKVTAGRYGPHRRWEVIDRAPESTEDPGVLEIRIPVKEVDDRMALPGSLTAILRQMIEEAEAREAKKS